MARPPKPPQEDRLIGRMQARPPRARYAAAAIVGFWLVGVIVFGTLGYSVDRESFDTIWDGWWWALQTVTTVGYGDVVPHQTAGRLVGVLLMLGGLSLLSIVTAVITSVFVARSEREVLGDPVLDRLDDVLRELDDVKQGLARLSARTDAGPGDAR